MNSLEQFKDSKRGYKKDLIDFGDLMEQIEGQDDYNKLQSHVQKAKNLKTRLDREQQEVLKLWEMLQPGDKANYKAKITQFNENYGRLKTRYKKQADRFESETNNNKLRIAQKKNTSEGFNEDLRQKLINGTGDLNQMENQLNNIQRTGLETAEIMDGANKDLRGQRDVIIGISDKNQNINNNLDQGAKVITKINYGEMKQRFCLYLTILILFITDIFLTVFVITRKFGSGSN